MKSRQTAERRNLFIVKIGFSPIKSPNASIKSIKKKIWKSRNQYFILTSFIVSKKYHITTTFHMDIILFFIFSVVTITNIDLQALNVGFDLYYWNVALLSRVFFFSSLK
jgi:hypothetical protein